MKLLSFDHAETFDHQISSPETSDFPDASYKYCSLTYIRPRVTEYVNHVLDLMLEHACGDYKSQLVDVKTHDLKKGVRPALNNWHFDNISWDDPKIREENNILFISHDCSLTEFLAHDYEVPDTSLKTINSENREAVSVEPLRLIKYGRLAHRASRATKSGRRLLIRLSETNKTTPQNKKFQPTYV